MHAGLGFMVNDCGVWKTRVVISGGFRGGKGGANAPPFGGE